MLVQLIACFAWYSASRHKIFVDSISLTNYAGFFTLKSCMSNHMLYFQKSHSSVQHVQPISFTACLVKHLIACLVWFSSPRQKLSTVASIFLTNLVRFQRCVLQKTYSKHMSNQFRTYHVRLSI